MKIGVLSDSHGDMRTVQRAVDTLRKHEITTAIHCGDIGLEVLPLLKGFNVHFVHGNMDDPNRTRDVIAEPEHTLHQNLGTLEIEGRRIAFLHGHDIKLLRHTIHSGHYDLVCHGHTHVFSNVVEGQTRVLNPGALARTMHPSVAIVDIPSLEVTRIPL